MGAGVGEQVRKLELDAYQAFLKVTAVTGMSWVSATSAAPSSAPTVPPNDPPSPRRFAVTRPAHAFPPSPLTGARRPRDQAQAGAEHLQR